LSDIYINVLNINGSSFGQDILEGNEKNNIIRCPAANCLINGQGGDDFLFGVKDSILV